MTIIFIRKNCVSRRKIMPDYTQEFTTIPYGPLGIIALPGCEELAQKSTVISSNGALRSSLSTKTAFPLQDMKEILISLMPHSRDSARAKAKARFTSPFAVTIFYCMRYVQLRRDLQYVRSNNSHESGRAFCQP